MDTRRKLTDQLYCPQKTNNQQASNPVQQLRLIETKNGAAAAQQLAVVGHGLKSPLTRIVALAEVLLKEVPGSLNAEQKEYLQDIYNNSYLLVNSINSLLSISKSDGGFLKLNLGPYDLEEVVNGVVIKVDSIAVSKGSEIVVDIPETMPMIYFDRDKMEQILFNLLDNAMKFTQEGTITVSVREDGPDNVVLSVRDTGIGIERKKLSRVFDKFFTDRNALNPGGSGLGLSVVKEFAELHGGHVSLESSEGKGTSVFVTIPKRLASTVEGLTSHAGNSK